MRPGSDGLWDNVYAKEVLELLLLTSWCRLVLFPPLCFAGSDGLWDDVYAKEVLKLLPLTSCCRRCDFHYLYSVVACRI